MHTSNIAPGRVGDALLLLIYPFVHTFFVNFDASLAMKHYIALPMLDLESAAATYSKITAGDALVSDIEPTSRCRICLAISLCLLIPLPIVFSSNISLGYIFTSYIEPPLHE